MNSVQVTQVCLPSNKQEKMDCDASSDEKTARREVVTTSITSEDRARTVKRKNKIKFNSLIQVDHDITSVLRFRQIELLEPHTIKKYLQRQDITPDVIFEELNEFQKLIDKTKKLVEQTIESFSMSTKDDEPNGPVLDNSYSNDTNKSAEALDVTNLRDEKPSGSTPKETTGNGTRQSDELDIAIVRDQKKTDSFVVNTPLDCTSETSGSKDQLSRDGNGSYDAFDVITVAGKNERGLQKRYQSELFHQDDAKKIKLMVTLDTDARHECNPPLMSNLKNEIDLACKSTRKFDRDLELPYSLGKLIDELIFIINIKREKILFPQDLMSFWLMLEKDNSVNINDVVQYHGKNIRKLIMAVCLDFDSALKSLHSLQKTINKDEPEISSKQFDDLKKYLKEHIFNDKKVGFSFDDLGKMIGLMSIDKENYPLKILPPKLSYLVKKLIDRMISLRTCTDVAMKLKDVMENIGRGEAGRFGKYFVELLYAISRSSNKLDAFISLQYKLEKLKFNYSPVSEDCSITSLDRHLTEYEVCLLTEYFNQNVFQKWLLTFTVDDLQKYMNRNP